VIGLVDALTTVPPTPRLADGDAVVALGATGAELGGSEWATLHGLRDGRPPAADLAAGAALHALVRDLVADRVVYGIHDCADGGLAVAVAEMAIASGVGATLTSPADLAPPDLVPGVAWFSESASRVVLSVAPEREAEVLAAAAGAGVPVRVLGRAGGDRIEADGAFSVSVAEATTAWRDAIPNILGTLPVPVD
jgi:phosphoribosylformylglycinamidine (FGAM) synthase-like enzyme